jgi:hypothetical protein
MDGRLGVYDLNDKKANRVSLAKKVRRLYFALFFVILLEFYRLLIVFIRYKCLLRLDGFHHFEFAGPVCAKAGGKFIIFWAVSVIKGCKMENEFGFHHIFRFLFGKMIREIIDKTAATYARCCNVQKLYLKLVWQQYQ